jgi:hypothetical protein
MTRVPEWLFPVCLMILNVLSGSIYFANGKVFKGIYWFSAAMLTFTVTFDEKKVIKDIVFLAQKLTKVDSF